MILRLQTAVNSSGWTRQMIIDTDRKTYKRGSFLFSMCNSVTKLTVKQLNDFESICIENGFIEESEVKTL